MKQEHKKPILAAFAALALMGSVAACNTVKGAGEDIEGAGDAISDTATDTQKEIEQK